MSLLKANSVQIGQSATATQNFTLSVPSSPDGTIKLARGNSGATTADVLTVDASGNVTTTLANGIVTPAKLSQPMTLGTSIATTSGTYVELTGIPSWAKKVSVLFNKVGITGASNMLVQLGTSGGIQGNNYEAQGSVVNASVATLNSTSGFPIRNVESSARISGIMTIATLGSNLWVMSGTLTVIGGTASVQMVAGSIQLSGVLDRVRINALNAENLDEGSVNIIYEG